MGEARQTCPHCERPPGGVHARVCPRGRVRMFDMAKGSKIVKHLHRANFVWRAGTLLTDEEWQGVDPKTRDGLTRRVAWYRSKRRGDRAYRIEARPKGKAAIPMYYVPQQGTYRKAG